jgi:putative addiction module component (TIGR02574 family)
LKRENLVEAQHARESLNINGDSGIHEGERPMESAKQLAKKAMELDPVERIRLVEAILHSLDKSDFDIEQSWIAESEARYEAYKRGELKGVDWEEIKTRII